MTPPTVAERLAALTAKTERIIQREILTDAQREIALAKQRDPRAVRDAIREARAHVERERRRAESAAATATGDLSLANIAREVTR